MSTPSFSASFRIMFDHDFKHLFEKALTLDYITYLTDCSLCSSLVAHVYGIEAGNNLNTTWPEYKTFKDSSRILKLFNYEILVSTLIKQEWAKSFIKYRNLIQYLQTFYIDEEITFFGLADFPNGTAPKKHYLKIVTPLLWCFAYVFINFSLNVLSKKRCTVG